ncbi:uncharacterized protein RHO25_011864 [Cercospora beticola]|uniref:DUF7587 domain-containing protein n=1 Tax=Cercospora beticola TaxID=122368 RepID=A0ABZ0P5T9_CERBT|nr:hypothetical protein RHO25_011864 [Cercospora beticola]
MVQHSPEPDADDVFDSFQTLSMVDHDVSKAELQKLNQRVLKACMDFVHSVRVLQASLAWYENDIAQDTARLSYLHRRLEEVASAVSSSATAVRFWQDHPYRYQNGPTLFWPLDEHDGCGEMPEPPKYLFRTADDSSSGQNNVDFIASAASIVSPGLSKIDLLSPRTRSTAAQRLHNHLRKQCFDDQDITDNLSSWSSSLLFVVQYALWRARKGRRPLDQVMIYAVDTTEFPRGQFASDKWLLKKLGDDVPATSWEWSLMTLRAKGYDNGEYLSQGMVDIRNRSCAISLANLLFSGLYDLYPEFKDQTGSEKWTKRVQDLRSDWAASNKTTRDEISSAMQVAATCFEGFNYLDIAVVLLTFKNRRRLNDDESSGE